MTIKINITGIETDISLERAIRAHDGISFRSEKRGAAVVAEYVERLTALAAHIEKHATDPRQQAIAQQVFDDLRAKYRKRTDAWIAARSRCISSMITGPARFPVRRAEKANNSEHKQLVELLEFSRAMDGYALKSLKWALEKEEKAPAKAVKLPAPEMAAYKAESEAA